MITTNLQGVAESVIRRAHRQGFIIPKEVREELKLAGLPDTFWKEVLTLCRHSLNCRKGRYYYVAVVSERMREEQKHQQVVRRVIRQLIRRYRAAHQVERRSQDRIAFVQPVTIHTEDHRTLRLLSRDLSPTGIRLIGTRSLLGQKVRLGIVQEGGEECLFLVRILWTCAVGDELFENGGTFLEAIVAESDNNRQKSSS